MNELMDDSVILTDTCRQLNEARRELALLKIDNDRLRQNLVSIHDNRPWSGLLGEENSPWDSYGAWETYIRRKLSEHTQADWDDCDGCLQAELYSLWCDLADSINGGMSLDRAEKINADCCGLVLRKIIGDRVPGETEPSIAEYTLAELLHAKLVIEVEEDRQEKNRKPGEGYTLHTTCDDRLLAALYACQNYDGEDQANCEPVVVIGRKALAVVNLVERRDEE